MRKRYKAGADVRIVVMLNGIVQVGVYARDAEAGVVRLTDASIIRRWGTDRGLAQLAIEGIRSETQLDYGGEVEAPWHAVIYTVHCTHPSWFELR